MLAEPAHDVARVEDDQIEEPRAQRRLERVRRGSVLGDELRDAPGDGRAAAERREQKRQRRERDREQVTLAERVVLEHAERLVDLVGKRQVELRVAKHAERARNVRGGADAAVGGPERTELRLPPERRDAMRVASTGPVESNLPIHAL